uniref:Uncharacterized protein n=1 Tax=Anguilla anguilla TaxID=7936 RepID=A0A0E9U5T5_ANGAN
MDSIAQRLCTTQAAVLNHRYGHIRK